MKNISLEPTNKPGVYSVQLADGFSKKIIGKFNKSNCTFTAQRSEKKHLFRNTNSLAICETVLNELPVRWIEILYTDLSGRLHRLATSKEYLIAHGKRAAFKETNWEGQYFLELSKWNLQAAQRYHNEINSQPSLFGVA